MGDWETKPPVSFEFAMDPPRELVKRGMPTSMLDAVAGWLVSNGWMLHSQTSSISSAVWFEEPSSWGRRGHRETVWKALYAQSLLDAQDLLEPRGWKVTAGSGVRVGPGRYRWLYVSKVRWGGHRGDGPDLSVSDALDAERLLW